MKNYFTIFPGIKQWKNYFTSLRYKIFNPSLLIGYNCELKNVRFGNRNAMGDYCSLNNASIGDYSYISSGAQMNNITIGKFCSIGPNCYAGMGMHPVDEFISTHPAFYSERKQNGSTFASKNYFQEFAPINIGNDVWIGANVMILDGIKIGDGAVIAAGAVVTKDVDPYSIVGGIPAKEIRKRFSEDKVLHLQKLKWWNFSDKWFEENAHFFLDKDEFFSRF